MARIRELLGETRFRRALRVGRNAAFVVAAFTVTPACSVETSHPNTKTPTAFFDTAPWEDPFDAVLRVASVDGECSATAVSDRVAITSRRCLERIMRWDRFATESVRARVGGGVVPYDAIPVHAVLATSCHGVAALVTERSLRIPSLKLRLGSEVVAGEPVRVAGYGRCTDASFGTRKIGFAARVKELSGPTFTITGDACSGDAGGPLLSEWTGEVVGVLDGDPLPLDVDAKDMTPGPAGSVDRVDRARSLLAAAFLVAHGVPAIELPPILCE